MRCSFRKTGAEQLEKIYALNGHDWEHLDEIRRLEHQLVTIGVEEERREGLDVESIKVVPDAKVAPQMRKRTFGCSSAGRPPMVGNAWHNQGSLPRITRVSENVGKAPSGRRGSFCHV